MTRILLTAIAAALLMVATMAQTGSKPSSGQATNVWTLSVEKGVKEESVADMHSPKSVTVCNDGANPVLLSIDGKHWHRLEVLGDRCVQAPLVRYVKLKRDENETSVAEVYATY